MNEAAFSAAGASTTVTATTFPSNLKSTVSKQDLGQFFTPTPVADFMASLFELPFDEIHLLDAGAGEGALTEAFVRWASSQEQRPRRLAVVAYEVDDRVLDRLRQTMERCEVLCGKRGIEFASEIRPSDFIEAALEFVRDDLFRSAQSPFNAALLNPPTRKSTAIRGRDGCYARRALKPAISTQASSLSPRGCSVMAANWFRSPHGVFATARTFDRFDASSSA